MKRYQQQIILPEIGHSGQEKLSSASVLVIGAGGLGTIVCSYLAAMGIGKMTICDFDTIDESNLHRQFFYTPNETGLNKADVLAKKLQLQNPNIRITSIIEKISPSSAQILHNHQVICDCSDNLETRLFINQFCESHQVPLIHGAVSDWQGYLSVFHYKKKYNLLDMIEINDFLKTQSCSAIGINSTICGIIGSYMANETIKVVLNSDFVLEGKLLYFNGWNNITKCLNLKKHSPSVGKSIMSAD